MDSLSLVIDREAFLCVSVCGNESTGINLVSNLLMAFTVFTIVW